MNSILQFITKADRTSIVKKNIVGSLFIKGVSIIVSLMLVPLTLEYVSSEIYGIWLTLSSIMVWLNFFDVGFNLGLKNKLAEALATGNIQRGRALVSTTYGLMIFIFVPVTIIIWIVIPLIDWSALLNVSAVFNEEIKKSLYIMGACFCLQMIFGVLTAVVAAYQKVALSSSFSVVGNIIALLVIYILTKTIPSSLSYLALTVSAVPVFVFLIASIYLYSKDFKNVAPNFKYVNKKYVKDLFNLGFKFFIIQIQVVVMFQTTNILISNLSGPNEVTAYNIAYKFINIALMVYNIILSPLWPAFTDAYTKKDFIWMKKVYRRMLQVWFISVFIIIMMVIVSPWVYNLWIGNKAQVPLIMTIVVAVYTAIHSLDSLQVMLINGTGCIKLQTYVTLIGLVFHIPFSFLLGSYFGCYGVLISMTLIVSIYLAFFTTQINKIMNQQATGIWIQ